MSAITYQMCYFLYTFGKKSGVFYIAATNYDSIFLCLRRVPISRCQLAKPVSLLTVSIDYVLDKEL